MTYKRKITFLSGAIAALVILYILTIIFDPQRIGSRSDAYTWLDLKQKNRIDRINIISQNEAVVLERSGGEWFVSHDGKDYPARQMRVDDFIDALGKRASYPVRSSSASSHERLSLVEGISTQIIVSAGAGIPLLNLLIGQGDVTGQDVYLRKQGHNEVRSGKDIFSAYTESTLVSWYNLRLFPESETGKLDPAGIQRLTVYPPAGGGDSLPCIFARRGREWSITGMDIANPDIGKIDSYIRDILNATGDDFADTAGLSSQHFNDSRIVLELGDGSIRTLRLGAGGDDDRYLATVTGSDYVYAIPGWVSRRLFPEPDSFEKDL